MVKVSSSTTSSSSSSSPDEESDLQNLLEESDSQIDQFRISDEAAEQRPTFDVESLRSRLRRSFKLNLTKKQSIFIFLPIVIILIYLSTDFSNYFSVKVPNSAFRSNTLTGRVHESDLQALYLLRKQESDLFSIWNHTVSNLSTIDDVKSAVFRQISLNRQIQNALLSPHKTGNVDIGGSSDGYFAGGSCRKVDQKLNGRKTIQWKPRPDKFLFAICLSGQMSNHLICLEKHMFFAALLKRVLVIPSHRFDYHYSRIIDIDRINTCLGRTVVVSFEEFWKKDKNRKKHHHVHINRFICYFSKPEPCYVDKEHITKLKALGITVGGKLDTPWEEDIARPSNKTAEEVEANFRSDDDVIAIGDVFYANVEREWVMQPGGPVAHKCRTLIEPNRLILLTAQRFIQTFLGKNYIALHFRRHGFLKFCNAKNPSCFFPIPQAASCITRLIEKVEAPVLYLSTDAAESETGLLQSLLILNGKTVPLVKRPARDSAEKWDALLYRHGLEGDSQVEAMLDKTICALSSVFIGASGSTFTEDILRLRKDWGTASECDEYLCANEQPNFIADHE
ncbi:O-fucosyltransferase family protein [Arabidopsis thaliana]|jgi:peptide-O-fucosyltransferase|uniref:O-fucosyltransferase 14 n=1 Tax=Arabidopsis thaliana TaxID=3702 RepID=OFT14_ARATH|eukprot:NP_175780.1 O-fucosyltransferase family protein [Arabidopsis thaliana]